jgi:uncharacterized protein YutE (UPF0331/DUF86 family)
VTREAAVLADLLDRLGREAADLRRLAGLAPEEILSDIDKLKSVKYSFVIAIEVCIDIAQHLVSRNALRAPVSFADAFAVLHEAGVLDEGLAADLADMARFRNLLVHGYARVDDRIVVRILRDRLGDIDAFVRAVAAA